MRSWAGAWLVFFPLVVTWVCDTAAMFGGRADRRAQARADGQPGEDPVGEHRRRGRRARGGSALRPLVFPRVGVTAALGSSLVIAARARVVGQVGDLAESLFKREAGVEGFEHLIPGHGGVLDRLDSLYFVLPVAAALYRFFGVI